VDFVGRWSVRLELLHGLACGLGAEKALRLPIVTGQTVAPSSATA
jgi:hypothetical protein